MKVTFNGNNKIIQIMTGVTSIDVKEDLYSAWKEWVLEEDNSKWPEAMRSVGGDPLTAGRYLGSTYFLMNGWKMKPWSGHHTLVINGNIYSEDASNMFVAADGAYNVQIQYTTSNLIDTMAINGGGGSSYTLEQIAQAVWNMVIPPAITPSIMSGLMQKIAGETEDIQEKIITLGENINNVSETIDDIKEKDLEIDSKIDDTQAIIIALS